MGTNTLTTIAGPGIDDDDLNQLKTAMSGAIVPRNSSGVPTDLGANFGTSTYPWKKIYARELRVDSIQNQIDPNASTGNDIISGRSRTSGQPAYLVPAGTGAGRSVVLDATTTAFQFSVNGVTKGIQANVSISSLTAAPSSNNTATVNDSAASGGFQEKTWGEEGAEKDSITVTSMGSEISALVGTYQAFLIGTEAFLAFVESSTKLSKIFRGYFYDEDLVPVNRAAFSNSATITLLKAAWLFLRENGTTSDVTYNPPVWSADEPGSPASGNHWYDLKVGYWKRYNGSAWISSGSTFLGIAVCNSNDCLFAHCEPFASSYLDRNTFELEIESVTVVRSRSHDDRLLFAGRNVNPGTDLRRWDIASLVASPDSYTTEASSTHYFLYLDAYGEEKISDIEPYYRRDIFAWVHPHNPWICVGRAYNDASSNLVYVRDIPTRWEDHANLAYQVEHTSNWNITTSWTTVPQNTAVQPSVTEGIFPAGSNQIRFRQRGWYLISFLVQVADPGTTPVVGRRFQNVTDGTTVRNMGVLLTDEGDNFHQEDCASEALVYISNLDAAYEFQAQSSSGTVTAHYTQSSIYRLKDLVI